MKYSLFFLILYAGSSVSAMENTLTKLERQLVELLQNKNSTISQITSLLDQGADIHFADKNGNTLLMYTAICKRPDITELFIKRGAQVNSTNFKGETALTSAATFKALEVGRILLENGADADAFDSTCSTPLHWAVAQGCADMVRLLITYKCNIEGEGSSMEFTAYDSKKRGQTPLRIAAFKGYAEICSLLIDAGAAVDVPDENGDTPLNIAAKYGNYSACDILINKGKADVNTQNSSKVTPLMAAAYHGHSKLCDLLLTYGATLEARDENAFTALAHAAANDKIETIKLLVLKGSNLYAANGEQVTPEAIAIGKGHGKAAGLLQKYRQLASNTTKGDLLIRAANKGDIKEAKKLLQEGVSVNYKGANDFSPLMIASALGHKELCKLLLDNGAEVNAQEIDCGTALLGAAKEKRHEIARLLLEKGARIDLIHTSEFTPLTFAVFNDDYTMCSILLGNTFFIPKDLEIPQKQDADIIDKIYTYTIKRLKPLCEDALTRKKFTQEGLKIQELIAPESLDVHFGKAIKNTIVKQLFGEKCCYCNQSNKKLLRCGRCKKVKYCSRGCQKSDWKNHKESCKK